MFDEQTPVVAIGAAAALVLLLVLPAAVIEAHTGHRTWLSRLKVLDVRRTPGWSLLLELPIIVILVGGSQFVMLAAVLSPISGLVTRAIGLVELVVFIIWCAHIIRSYWRDSPRTIH